MNDYRIFPDQEPVDRRLIDVRKRKPMKRPNAGLRIRVLPGFGACASSLRVDAVLAKYSSLLSDIRIRNHLEALSCLTMVALAMPSSMAGQLPEARIVNADDQFQHDIKDPAESSKSTRLAKTARRHWPPTPGVSLHRLCCRQTWVRLSKSDLR